MRAFCTNYTGMLDDSDRDEQLEERIGEPFSQSVASKTISASVPSAWQLCKRGTDHCARETLQPCVVWSESGLMTHSITVLFVSKLPILAIMCGPAPTTVSL